MNPKLPSGSLEKLWSDSNNWRNSIIYRCKDDPRLVVPKRCKWGGWTLNFAHPFARVVLLLVFLSFIVPIGFLLAGWIGTVGWLASLTGMIVFWCVMSAVLASPKRYENAA